MTRCTLGIVLDRPLYDDVSISSPCVALIKLSSTLTRNLGVLVDRGNIRFQSTNTKQSRCIDYFGGATATSLLMTGNRLCRPVKDRPAARQADEIRTFRSPTRMGHINGCNWIPNSQLSRELVAKLVVAINARLYPRQG
jgi:hypothetical protein